MGIKSMHGIMGMNDTPLEIHVRDLVVKAITESKDRKRVSVHVTDLSQPCMRKVWYDIKGVPYEHSFKTKCNFKMGNIVHEGIILNKKQNEVSLKGNIRTGKIIPIDSPISKTSFYDCISGKVDDIIVFNGSIIIVDKKTFSSKYPIAVKTQIDSDYIFQLNEYKYLYWLKTGQEIERGVIAYLDVATKLEDIRVFETELWSLDYIKEQVLKKLDILKSETEPYRVVTKRCKTCPFVQICKPEQEPNFSELVKIWK